MKVVITHVMICMQTLHHIYYLQKDWGQSMQETFNKGSITHLEKHPEYDKKTQPNNYNRPNTPTT
jgi:hypothetical protein